MTRRRILFVDATAGASGDMILGAFVDLGVPAAKIRRAVRSLPIGGWTLRSRRIVRGSLAARKIDVRARDEGKGRNWRAISRVLRGGELDPAVRRKARSIFRRLIEAEAEAHGESPERVHLHEAGAVDAIVDIVGACVGLAHLAPDRIVVSPMTTGHGQVRCRHGIYPVPAPATLLLVRGHPVRAGEIASERLTPTGAAILTEIADAWGALPSMRPRAVGYGAGDREFDDSPNLLRMVIGDEEDAVEIGDAEEAPQVAVIECTLDDSTPQVIAFASERLLDRGALDVFSAPVTMKKGRCGQNLTVLARPDRLDELMRVLLAETSSLGLRYRIERRVELARSHRRVRTRFGSVRVKTGMLDGKPLQAWPEYEDCVRLARRHAAPLREVQHAALQAYHAIRKPKR